MHKPNSLPTMDGPEIRRVRNAAGIKLRAFAQQIEMDPGALSHLERGHRTYFARTDRVQRFADALGVAPKDIIRPAATPDELGR
jgi:transcriptional regulator with XRE-family HTH domain